MHIPAPHCAGAMVAAAGWFWFACASTAFASTCQFTAGPAPLAGHGVRQLVSPALQQTRLPGLPHAGPTTHGNGPDDQTCCAVNLDSAPSLMEPFAEQLCCDTIYFDRQRTDLRRSSIMWSWKSIVRQTVWVRVAVRFGVTFWVP